MASLIVAGVITGCVYTLVALGLILVYRTSGAVNFAAGDVGGIGVLLAVGASGGIGADLSVSVGVLVGLAVAGAVSVALYVLFVQIVEKRGGGASATMMVTLGASLIIETALNQQFGGTSYSLGLFAHLGTISVFGVSVGVAGVAIVASAVLALGAFGLLLYFTRIGLILRMSASSAMLAQMSGVNLALVRGIVWALAGIASAWGMMLFSAYQSVSVTTIAAFLLLAAVAASWGGFERVTLTLVGACALGVVDNIVSRYVPYDLLGVSAFGVLLIVFSALRLRRGVDYRASDGLALLRRHARAVQHQFPWTIWFEASAIALAMLLLWYLGGRVDVDVLHTFMGTIVVLCGLGMSLGYAARLNLGASAFMAIGAYSFVALAPMIGIYEALCAGVAIAAVIGAGFSAVTSGMHPLYYATLSLLLSVVVPELAVLAGHWTGGASGKTVIGGLFHARVGSTGLSGLVLVCVTVASLAFVQAAGHTKVGRRCISAASDRNLALTLGIAPVRYVVLIELCAAGVMALGGIMLVTSVGYITPGTYGITQSVTFLAGAVVGGLWSPVGVLVGGALVALLPVLLGALTQWAQIIEGAVLVGVMIVSGQGAEELLSGAYARIGRAMRERKPSTIVARRGQAGVSAHG